MFSQRPFMKKFLVGAAVSLSLLTGTAYYIYSNTARILIFHTNDIHGWILPQKGKGGFATLSNVLKREGRGYLLLDSGDFFQGTPEGDLTKGEAVIECMNRLGYQASSIGNHEYDLGEKQLARLAQMAKFPFLDANIFEAKTGKRVPYVQPYLIKEVDGIKVGIIGITTSLMHSLTVPRNVEHLTFEKETDALRRMVEEVKAEGAKVIIVLSHVGFETKDLPKDFVGDKFLASNVEGVQLILGGHSHFPVYGGYRDPKNKTWIAHNQWGLGTVSRTMLRVWKKSGKVFYSTSKLVPLEVEKYGEDEEIKKYADSVQQKVGAHLGEVIGQSKTALDRQGSETLLGNWQTDVMRAYAKSDFAFQNIGGIRSDIPEGELTLRNLYLVSPFENSLFTMELTGEEVREILEHSVSGPQGILQLSGLSMSYDPQAPGGKKLLDVTVNGKPIDLKKNYSIATNSFLAEGGDGFLTFKKGRKMKDSYVNLRNIQIEFVKKNSPISSKIEGRITQKQ